MKILCVINSLRPGGAQRQLANLSIGLKNKDIRVVSISKLFTHNREGVRKTSTMLLKN